MHIKECVLSLNHSITHSLTQHGPDAFMEDWVTNFDVQIGFEALTPSKTKFCEIPPLPPWGAHISEYDSASNYLTMTKLYMGRLDLEAKKFISAILEFSILRGGKGGNR